MQNHPNKIKIGLVHHVVSTFHVKKSVSLLKEMMREHRSRENLCSGRKFKAAFTVYLHYCRNLKIRQCVNSSIDICQLLFNLKL